jgi:hypothetical protein
MGEDDQLRIYEKGRKHEHTEGQSPVIKNAALCFQEWNAGVTPKFLNISLRLIIIGDGQIERERAKTCGKEGPLTEMLHTCERAVYCVASKTWQRTSCRL